MFIKLIAYIPVAFSWGTLLIFVLPFFDSLFVSSFSHLTYICEITILADMIW